MLRHLRLIAFCAGLLASAGCSNEPPTGRTPPSAPSSLPSFSVRAISPSRGSSAGVTIARISGAGFQSGATVTVDGSRVDATVLDPNTITLAMPAHPAGKVDVTVFEPLSEAKASVPGGYTYFVVPEPVISELIPNIGSAAGGAPLIIRGPGLAYAVTVTVDGIVTPFVAEWDDLYLSMPAHQAGTVEVVVTNTDGQMASSVFTYASPGTLDFNGDWQGWAQDLFAPPGSHEWARLVLSIRDNLVVSFSCSPCRAGENCGIVTAPGLTLDPPPVVANGEFSSGGSGGVSITGRILSPISASGSINTASCGSRPWKVEKKQ